MVRPASVARTYGAKLLEHVWNAALDEVAVTSNALSLLREEVSRSGGDLLTLAR
ncbi:hypothetical protein [Nitrosospira multiformis]|uniref:hypothetical protein n=1 Tax=Nitrosospira multiformis TaxID=1231 RepID=UPI000896FF76|nr:hypothetical protein [Nitrosospira multiformis]SEA76662.1 hypothetical protein SAMN05216411_1343 [Nitrosospira multiformis]